VKFVGRQEGPCIFLNIFTF
jgi:hypothetical protein